MKPIISFVHLPVDFSATVVNHAHIQFWGNLLFSFSTAKVWFNEAGCLWGLLPQRVDVASDACLAPTEAKWGSYLAVKKSKELLGEINPVYNAACDLCHLEQEWMQIAQAWTTAVSQKNSYPKQALIFHIRYTNVHAQFTDAMYDRPNVTRYTS